MIRFKLRRAGYIIGLATVCPSIAAAPPVETIAGVQVGAWTKTAHSQVPTDCDRMASYAPDRDAVAPPLAHDQIDVPAAITACRAAIAAEPTNPRLHYQIARLLDYSKDEAGARAERLTAARGGYPSAIYLLGFQKGFATTGADRCGGAALIRRAADLGAFAGQVGLANYQLSGAFAGCPAAGSKATLSAMMTAAKGGARGYFEELLVESLSREVARLP